MQMAYELTQQDFYDGFIAHRNRTPLSKWSFRILVSAMFLLVGLALLGAVSRPGTRTPSLLLPLVGLLALWSFVTWGAPWWSARSQYGKQPSAKGLRTLLLDNEGVHKRGNGVAADYEWRSLIRWVESNNQFLLYSSPASFNIVPKRSMTPEQVNEFRTLLTENIKPR
jgi:hypothetical protein